MNIPFAALEAGAIELAPHPWSMYTEAAQDKFRGKDRACFNAMIGAWEGKEQLDWCGLDCFVLPIPEEDTRGA